MENIAWVNYPKAGHYSVFVENFCYRESTDTGFEVELEYDGEVYNYHVPANGGYKKHHSILEFDYSRDKGVVVKGGTATTGKYHSKEKWGLKTGMFHKVRAITLSPNYWDGAVGNKHWFFFLEGCKSDEKTRGFYNEFLRQDLDKDRKVFEVLGSQVSVEPAQNELSGIGFSETLRKEMIVEVAGAFKRTLRIKF